MWFRFRKRYLRSRFWFRRWCVAWSVTTEKLIECFAINTGFAGIVDHTDRACLEACEFKDTFSKAIGEGNEPLPYTLCLLVKETGK